MILSILKKCSIIQEQELSRSEVMTGRKTGKEAKPQSDEAFSIMLNISLHSIGVDMRKVLTAA